MKYVYLIQSLDDGFFKIGVSKHPHKRLEQMQTSNHCKLKLVASYRSQFANMIEKTLHSKYLIYRKRGEWFELSLENEVSFIGDCETIHNNISYLYDNNNIYITKNLSMS